MVTPTRICFIRHCETDWNAVKRIQGQTDIPLSKTGHAQALAMSCNAAGYDFSTIYSSDLIRSSATAQLLATRCELEVQLLQELGERNYGIFQGCTAAKHRIIPRHASWRLNERHYGQLQGMYKKEIVAAWGIVDPDFQTIN